MNQTQIAFPVEVCPAEIARKRTLGDAIKMCVEHAPERCEKKIMSACGADKAQFSRWQSNQEGVMWEKFNRLMDACGNDAPLLWMMHKRGYDLHSIRKLESETEKENRLLREENAALRRAFQGKAVA